jgi:hypothetical protein
MVTRMAPSLVHGLATMQHNPGRVTVVNLLVGFDAVQTIRYAVVLLTGFIAGSRTVDAARSWREWHAWSLQDASGADAYRTFFLVNMAVAILSLCIAGLVWWLLRPGARERHSR